MWPGCNNCGADVPLIDDKYCGGERCVGKSVPFMQSSHKPHTKKKLNREIIKARRKKGRR